MLQQLFGGMADPASSIGLRALAAFLTSLAIGLALGPRFIARLKAMHFGQAVRTDGPQTHLKKDGTPTMGGALILGALTASLALWGDWSNRFLWVILFVTLGYGAIGWQDDYRKVVHHDPHGMSAREKFSWQSVIGLAAGFYLAVALSGRAKGFSTRRRIGTKRASRSTFHAASTSCSRRSERWPSPSGFSASSFSSTS